MAVSVYWQGRLIDRCPIFDPVYWIEKETYRPNTMNPVDRWPRAISRSALYFDYQAWFRKVHQIQYEEAKPATQLVFFSTLSPWLYVIGKKQQARSYPIPRQLHHAGAWNEGKITKYFVRLESWETHAAAFQMDTSIDVLTAIRGRDQIAGGLIEDIIRRKQGHIQYA